MGLVLIFGLAPIITVHHLLRRERGLAFWGYFFSATPLREIAELNIGSRPASRKATQHIEDLRAIPWGFSWGQCRIALPGWFGTFEEFCEVLTWGQLGFHVKPMGLLNVAGFFDPLLALFDRAVEEGFLRAENRAMALAETDIERLLDAMAAYRPEPVSKWLKESQQL